MKAIFLLCLVAVFACGAFAAPSKPDSRLLGGEDAEEGQFPYTVSVNLCFEGPPGPPPEPPTTTEEPDDDDDGDDDDDDDDDPTPLPPPEPVKYCQHICGGAIVDAQWVLTTAHCILYAPGQGYNSFEIVAGVLDIIDNSTAGGQVIEVTDLVIHPNYEGGVNVYDFALLKLDTALDFTSVVSAVDLPEEGYDSDNDVYISGWGATGEDEEGFHMPSTLQYVKTSVISGPECQAALDDVLQFFPHPFNETVNICTGPLTGDISICTGDSGNPVIDAEENVLVGIASWTVIPCGTVGAPSVHNRVSAVISWIEDYIA